MSCMLSPAAKASEDELRVKEKVIVEAEETVFGDEDTVIGFIVVEEFALSMRCYFIENSLQIKNIESIIRKRSMILN